MVSSNGLVESKSDAKSPLDDGERARLKELEAIVEQGLQTFYEVGKALIEIQEKKLYRETYNTFEAYCQNRWSIAKRTAYQYISGARVVENLCAIAHKIPLKENQVRALTGLSPELQIEIWEEAVASAPNGVPTGALVKRLVQERTSPGTTNEACGDRGSELDRLRLENKRLKENIRQKDLERERRAAEVATELERLRAENGQLRSELRQWEKDWEIRIAQEREKIAQELRVEIGQELKAEYEGQINDLVVQVKFLTQQLEEIRLSIKKQ